jgi:hypothetical protein
MIMTKDSRLFWLAVIATIMWMLLMRPFTPENIIQFELAKTVDTAGKIISLWGEAGIKKATTGIYLDFVFLILYSWSIGTGCTLAAKFSGIELFIRPALFFSRAAWFAGCCDLIENLSMLFTLSHLNEFSVSMAYYFAIVKFLIVVISLIFILLAAAVGLFNFFYTK